MRTTHLRISLAAAIMLSATLAPAHAQDTVARGPWQFTIGNGDLRSLTYRGEVIAPFGKLGGYLPAWKGNRFGMQGAEVAKGDASVTWHKSAPGNQEATLRAELTDTTCRYSLDTTVTAAGPSEFSMSLAPEGVRTDEGRCFVWVNGQPRTLFLAEPFEKFGGIDELRFEQPERTVIVRCSRFELQDRRHLGSGFYLVKVIGSSGVQPTTTSNYIEVEVVEHDPATLPGREALLSQQPLEYTDLEMRNAGFENATLEGWSHGPTTQLDAETKHGGKQSARLTIAGEVLERGHVYLIQSVPIEQGRSYQAEAWVKAQDVKNAVVNGMTAVGATVILEFADKQGKWFAPGSYGPTRFGTSGWTKVTSGSVLAPVGAGRAIVYLALRGTGTAWFDDVKVTEVKYPVLLLEPLTGQPIHDNTPRLNWHHEPKLWTTLQLSQSPEFPEGDTVEVAEVEVPPVQIDKPLAPGKWYWRVTAPGAVSDTWQFQQTASLDEDTTDPAIEETHTWLDAPRAPARFRFSDNVGVNSVKLVVDGEAVSAAVRLEGKAAQYVPPNPWSPGLHIAQVHVEDAAGNAAERKLFFTHSAKLPKTTWRQFGGVETDGKRRFLLGMYGVNIEHMSEMAAAGFDFVHSYRWDGSGTNEEALEYLDAAQKNGLQAFIGIDRQKLIAGDEQFVAERVGALMRHPALFAWYLFDEPDLTHQYVSPMWIQRYYRLLKALDPFHPVVLTCAHDDAVPRYRDGLDVHWTQVYGSTAFVAKRLERHRGSLREDTPLAAILHCYDRAQTDKLRSGTKPDLTKFQPDGRLLRANAFMAIAHNSSCLTWWWWGYGGGDRYLTIANAPEAWASLKQTLADIRSLEPVLTADGEVHTWIEKPSDEVEVHCWEKRLADRTVLIAVNRDDAACEVAIKPKTLATQCRVEVLFEGREVKVKGGELRDDFGALGVHVYQWTRDQPR